MNTLLAARDNLLILVMDLGLVFVALFILALIASLIISIARRFDNKR